jgi:hypothetical protein
VNSRCEHLNPDGVPWPPCSYAAFQLNYVLGDGGRTYLAGYSKRDVKFYWHKMVRRQRSLACRAHHAPAEFNCACRLTMLCYRTGHPTARKQR